jgi:hypothetical protein
LSINSPLVDIHHADPKLSRLLQLAELFEMKPAELFEPSDKTSVNFKGNKQCKNHFYIGSSLPYTFLKET